MTQNKKDKKEGFNCLTCKTMRKRLPWSEKLRAHISGKINADLLITEIMYSREKNYRNYN